MNAILTAAASLLVFGAVIFIHEFGHFITAKRAGITVNEFALGMGPKLFSFTRGETMYSLRLLPVGGYCMMEGEDEESDSAGSYSKAPVWARFRVVAAGAVMNLVLGFLVLICLTATGGAIASRTVSGFYENAATEASGLQVGDTILAVNGRRLYTADDIFYELMRVQGGAADFTVRRGGEKTELKDIRFDTATDEDGVSSIVLDFTVLPVEKNPFTVAREAVCWTLSLSRQIILSVGDLISGAVPMNQLSGPVGIVSVIGQATSYGLRSVLVILAYISINLGIMNVLPLPALDGGKLLLLAVEGVTHKKLGEKWEIGINAAGLALLLALMLFVTYNDLTRLFK